MTKKLSLCYPAEFRNFLLQKAPNRGIFNYLLTKGRPHWRISKT